MKTHVGVSPFLPVGLMTPQLCPFCSFLHAFLGPPLHCSPNLSLPQRHRKQCIVCPATKGNAETPSGPPTPSPPPSPSTPKPWGHLEFTDCQGSLYHLASPSPWQHTPLCFGGEHARETTGPSPPGSEESQEGPRQSRNLGFGTQTGQSPVQPGWVGETDRSVPCLIVLLKDYLVLVFVCHRGNCVGAGVGAGWQGLLILYQRCYQCDGGGVGGESLVLHGSGDAPRPLRPANVPFLFQSLFFILCFFFFFFPCGWGLM